ncbi:hypothetical protein [[Clostridium] fimetarium]|uniref:Uncharacterized protein n=1 Tax=[Clostridium] fimetarium TaxID=99656 RepID=A0A1I0M468_9FIRM|nr:hypothetical protein [[Clostridium] fimetarium]SEV83072.1 hypothetical protein SAMN05421659_101166 [[Clostridium] fimetarium]
MAKIKPIKDIDFQKNLNDLLGSDILKEICKIKCENTAEEILNQIDEYGKNENIDVEESNNKQSGRVWILVGRENIDLVPISLQVGQSLDILKEIKLDVKEMFSENNEKSLFYRDLKEKYGCLEFHELLIDQYLEKYACENVKEVVYEMAKEFYAEALVAYNTYSRNWGFYNSGMDKRAYFRILPDNK